MNGAKSMVSVFGAGTKPAGNDRKLVPSPSKGVNEVSDLKFGSSSYDTEKSYLPWVPNSNSTERELRPRFDATSEP